MVPNSERCRPVRLHSKIQRKRKGRQVLGHCQRTKKAMKHKSDGATNYNWRTWNDH